MVVNEGVKVDDGVKTHKGVRVDCFSTEDDVPFLSLNLGLAKPKVELLFHHLVVSGILQCRPDGTLDVVIPTVAGFDLECDHHSYNFSMANEDDKVEEIKLEVDPNGHQDDEDSGPMDYQNEDSDTEFAPKEEDSDWKSYTTTKGSLWACDQCTYVAKRSYVLKQHKQTIHEGIRHPCDQCDFSATQKSALNEHKRRLHAGLIS